MKNYNINTLGGIFLVIWIILLLLAIVFKVKSAFAILPIMALVGVGFLIWLTYQSLSDSKESVQSKESSPSDDSSEK